MTGPARTESGRRAQVKGSGDDGARSPKCGGPQLSDTTGTGRANRPPLACLPLPGKVALTLRAGLLARSLGLCWTPPLLPDTAEAARLVARTRLPGPPAPGREAAPIEHIGPDTPPG